MRTADRHTEPHAREFASENPCVKLQTPLELDKEFCFYVTPLELDKEFCFYVVRMEDGYAVDDDADTYLDAHAAVVEFQGFALAPPFLHTEEKGNNDHKEEQKTDSEIDRDVARASSAGGNGKDVGQVVAIGIFGFLRSFLC
uniref:Uncharacterized protein n=1 Tax=Aegilops tauschii TaxID=37682 RepID=M8C2E4_AEGTA